MRLVEVRRRLDLSLAGWSVVVLACSVVLWVLYWALSASAFDLSARSEVVQLTTGCRTQPRWIVGNADVRVDGAMPERFAGQIEIGPRARVRIERIGKGPLRIMVQRQRDADLPEACDADDMRSLAVIAHASTTEREGGEMLDPREQVVVETLVVETVPVASSTTMLPFVAWAEVGQSIKSATRKQSPILTSGSVAFLRSFFLTAGCGMPHPAGERTLRPGDRFFVPKQPAPGFGFARVDDEPALLVGYRASGDDAQVERFGTRGYAIGPTVVEAFAGDSSVQILLALLGAGAALAQTFDLLRRKEGGTTSGGSADVVREEAESGEDGDQRESAPADPPPVRVL